MITDERVTSFIRSLNREEEAFLCELERTAKEEDVPIIRIETRELLKLLILVKQPKRILEVGTAVGFSAIYMSQYLPPDATIITIEKYEPRIAKAKENFVRAGLQDRIELLEGDAADLLKELQEPFDMIFMDAAKGQYIHFLPEVLRLLVPGGVLVSDNILQDGDVLESHYAVPRRNRTIHSRMREYLYTLKHHDALETAIVPVGDGVALSVRLQVELVERRTECRERNC